MSLTTPSTELAKLRAEMEAEEALMLAAEQDVDMKATQLGYLHAEYMENVARISHFYAPKLEPQLRLVHTHQVQGEFIAWQMQWMEKKVVLQEKFSETSIFDERRDLRADALSWLKKVRQDLLRAYEQIETCPAESLKVLSNYSCPPDVAIETMAMTMRLRGDVLDANAATCWSEAQVLVSHNYFTNFFVKRSEGILRTRDMLDLDLLEALETFCAEARHSVEQLYRCSTPIGALGQWLHAVRDYYRVKLIVAPVLEDIFDERGTPLDKPASCPRPTTEEAVARTAETLALQFRFTLGPDYLCPDDPRNSGNALPSPNQLANSSPTAAKGEGLTINDDPEVLAALEAYQDTKARLSRLTRTATVNQQILYDLRHAYHQHLEAIRDAEEAMAAVKAEMQGKIQDVIANYDGTMVPIEDQLENKTQEFMDLISAPSRTGVIENKNGAAVATVAAAVPEIEAGAHTHAADEAS